MNCNVELDQIYTNYINVAGISLKTHKSQYSAEKSLYLYMNDCSVLQRCGSAVPGSYFQSVIWFSLLVEKLCCPDVSSFTVNLKVSKTFIF